MKENPENIVNTQLQLFFLSAFLLFISRMFFGSPDSLVLKLLFDLLIGCAIFFLLLSFIKFENKRGVSPLSLVMNVGILSAIMFFIIKFSDFLLPYLFDNLKDRLKNPTLLSELVSLIYLILFIGFISYFLQTLRHLFYLNQRKNVKVYFNTMLIFFVLASLSNNYLNNPGVSFLKNTFFIVAIMLMVFNSMRISWIAFLSKKEKLYLIILSLFISVLFIVIIVSSSSDNLYSNIIDAFSPSLSKFNVIVMVYGSIYFFVLFFTTLFHLPTAEVYDRKAQEVTSLQYFSKLITQVLDFDELAETVTDITLKISGSSAAWIIWKENGKFNSIANKNIGYVESDKLTKFITDKIEFAKLESTKILHIKERLFEGDQAAKFSTILLSPIKTRGSVQGILVAAKPDSQIFAKDDVNAIETFSDYASVSIENSRLLEESIEKERLEKELDVARDVQQKILPTKIPDYPGLQIASVFIPAFEVGGDYYDFFEISKTKLGFIIADVSGKGISAAFIMAEVKGIFESLSKTMEKPKEILIKANDILRGTLDSRTFVSAAYGYIDLSEKKLHFARAGHCPLFLLRDKDSKQIKPLGLGLGLSDKNHFNQTLEEYSVELKKNDTIVLYTDGVTEAKNENLEDFGDKYFLDILQNNSNLSAQELSNKIIQEITVFSSNHAQYDDITLVIFKWQQ